MAGASVLDLLMRIRSDRGATSEAVNQINAVNAALDQTAQTAREAQQEMSGVATATARMDKGFIQGGGAKKAGRALSGLGGGAFGSLFMVMDDVGDLAEVMGERFGSLALVMPALAGAAAGAAIGIELVKNQLAGVREEGEKAKTFLEAYYAALRGDISSSDIEKQIADKRQKLDDARAQIELAKSQLDSTFADIQKNSGDFQARAALALGSLLNVNTAQEIIDKNTIEVARLESELSGMEAALKDGAGATKDAAEAAKEEADAKKELARVSSDNALRAAQYEFERAKFEATALDLSSKAIDTRLKSIEAERSATLAAIASLTASGVQSEETAKRIDELSNSLTALGQQSDYLQSIRDSIAAKEEEQRVTEETVDAMKQYNADVERINSQFYEEQSRALDRYTSAQVRASEAAAEAAEAALERLSERQSSLTADFARSEDEARARANEDAYQRLLDYQREEATAARRHADDLLNIQRDAQDREFDMILSRDFAGLFRSRRQTARAMEDANREYQRGRDERSIALQQENEDAIRQYAIERERRAAEYQQKLVDAQAQYQKERQQAEDNQRKALLKAREAYGRELQLASDKYNQELTLRRGAAIEELNMIRTMGQARIALEQQIQQSLLAQAQAMLSGLQGRSGVAFNQTNNITTGMSGSAVERLVTSRTSQLITAAFGS